MAESEKGEPKEEAAAAAASNRLAKEKLPPPSPAHRAAMAQNISSSLAPPPRADDGKGIGKKTTSTGQAEASKTPFIGQADAKRAAAIGQTEMKKTAQSSAAQTAQQEQEASLEIDMGDGQLASRRNPISESGRAVADIYVSKAQPSEKSGQKTEPVVLKPQARPLSANAARIIAKRRAMMEGQDQAGTFRLPGAGPDSTDEGV